MKHRLVIERAKWANPSYDPQYSEEPQYGVLNHGSSALLNDAGCMCCLGFAMREAGLPDDAINGTGTPDTIPNVVLASVPQTDFLEKFVRLSEEDDYDGPVYVDTKLSSAAVNINDDINITLAEREEQLVDLFANHDIELVFV